MKIGSHYEIEKITQDDFKLLAESLGVNVKVVNSIMKELKCVIEENPVVV